MNLGIFLQKLETAIEEEHGTFIDLFKITNKICTSLNMEQELDV